MNGCISHTFHPVPVRDEMGKVKENNVVHGMHDVSWLTIRKNNYYQPQWHGV